MSLSWTEFNVEAIRRYLGPVLEVPNLHTAPKGDLIQWLEKRGFTPAELFYTMGGHVGAWTSINTMDVQAHESTLAIIPEKESEVTTANVEKHLEPEQVTEKKPTPAMTAEKEQTLGQVAAQEPTLNKADGKEPTLNRADEKEPTLNKADGEEPKLNSTDENKSTLKKAGEKELMAEKSANEIKESVTVVAAEKKNRFQMKRKWDRHPSFLMMASLQL
jgi:hypothetical protein